MLEIKSEIFKVMQLVYKAKKELLEKVPRALELPIVVENGSRTWSVEDYEIKSELIYSLHYMAINDFGYQFDTKQLGEFACFIINYSQDNYNIRRVAKGLTNAQCIEIFRLYNRCHKIATR